VVLMHFYIFRPFISSDSRAQHHWLVSLFAVSFTAFWGYSSLSHLSTSY